MLTILEIVQALQQSPVSLSGSNMMNTRPPNEAILLEDISNNLITLHDLEIRDNADRKGILRLKDRIAITPVGWSYSFFLKQLPHAIQWHPALANYDTSGSSLQDVHLISATHSYWPVSLNHWSLYSQGSFFHLVLHEGGPRLQIDAFTTEQAKAELDAIRCQVRCDNMHRLNAHAESRQTPMIAYNIGQTQFNVTQIKGLAKYVTSQLQEYTRQEKNCHLFALSLGTRVLMTKGAGTIFAGTKASVNPSNFAAVSLGLTAACRQIPAETPLLLFQLNTFREDFTIGPVGMKTHGLLELSSAQRDAVTSVRFKMQDLAFVAKGIWRLEDMMKSLMRQLPGLKRLTITKSRVV